jgi:hypothetical protein
MHDHIQGPVLNAWHSSLSTSGGMQLHAIRHMGSEQDFASLYSHLQEDAGGLHSRIVTAMRTVLATARAARSSLILASKCSCKSTSVRLPSCALSGQMTEDASFTSSALVQYFSRAVSADHNASPARMPIAARRRRRPADAT